MTLQEQLGIIQAAIDGKEIEFYDSVLKQWKTKNTVINREFDFICIPYRIKPKPKREIKLHQYLIINKTTGHYISTTGFFPDKEKCKQHSTKWIGDWQVIDKLPHTEITVTED